VISIDSLGLDEAQRGIEAGMAAAREIGLPMSFAVVDAHGDLIAAARMDGSHTRVLKHAIRKAHTAATYGRNTLIFKRQLKETNRELLDWGDLNVTTLQGGLVVKTGSSVVGGVGAGGGSLEVDERVGRVVVKAMGFEPEEEPPAWR
jgi:glc operon protein GlcG